MAELAPPWLDNSDRIKLLGQFPGLSSDAAAIAIKAGSSHYHVIKLIEDSRAVIMRSSIDYRLEVSQLGTIDSVLEQKFNRLRMTLDSVHSKSKSDTGAFGRESRIVEVETSADEDLKDLWNEMRALLRTIRGKTGLESFLSMPDEESVVKLTNGGAIVIVLSSELALTGYAIIIQPSGINVVDLPKLNPRRVTEKISLMKKSQTGTLRTSAARNSEFQEGLSWLWDAVAQPVLQYISQSNDGILSNGKPHVNWIGVGNLSYAPFHAAADLEDKSSDAMDLCISSFAPSLCALQYSHSISQQTVSSDRLLFVSMPETPNACSLPNVEQELSEVKSAIGQSLQIKNLDTPSPEDVLKELPQHNIVHFACHALPDRVDPFDSHILLQNSERFYKKEVAKLYVRDIFAHRSTHADLAYLSACSTASIELRSIADEGIHIASALQLAGFKNVVANSWAQQDSICLEVSKSFYQELARSNEMAQASGAGQWPIAAALHTAVNALRKRKPQMVLQWASFIHIGKSHRQIRRF